MIEFARPLFLLFLVVPLGFFGWTIATRRSYKGLFRTFLVAVVIIALSGPLIRQQEVPTNIHLLVDLSASVLAAIDEEELQRQINELVAANPNYQFGLITFAAEPQLVIPFPLRLPVAPLFHQSARSSTDLSAAVDLAIATFPDGGRNKIVLLSDGRIIYGLDRGLAKAQLAGVPISVVPLGEEVIPDFAIDSFSLPAVAEPDRPFKIEVSIAATISGEGMIIIYREDEIIFLQQRTIERGITTITFSDTLDEPGKHPYRALVRGKGDLMPQNDILHGAVQVDGAASLLLLHGAEDAPHLRRLLIAAGRGFDTFSRQAGTISLAQLAPYRAVIMSDIVLTTLTDAEIAALRYFVQDLGGGLLVIAGEEEVRGMAAGGIADLLPVSYITPQRGEEARLCLVFVIDISASMRGRVGGVTQLDLVKEAVVGTIATLDRDDKVGIIVFNTHYEWIVPIQPLGDRRAIYRGLLPLRAEGGTDIYGPLWEAMSAIKATPARLRHIIVLSDGETIQPNRYFRAMLDYIGANNEYFTLSTIGTGIGINDILLQHFAYRGGGQFHWARDIRAIPALTIADTQRISRQRFISGDIAVVPSIGQKILMIEEVMPLPRLGGYVLTFPRPTAVVALQAVTTNDPIFAHWRTGLGKVAILNTDLDGDWTAEWLAWPQLSLLVDEMINSVFPVGMPITGLRPTVVVGDEQITVNVDAYGADGWKNFLSLRGLILPGEIEFSFSQIGPGRYRGQLPLLPVGGYLLQIEEPAREQRVRRIFVVPFAEEYRQIGLDIDSLIHIAMATGGSYIGDEIIPPPAGNGEGVFTYRDISMSILLGALLLFVAELGLRKLPWRIMS
ncbi:VWA domain-containing protein [Candidatus Acetothermia bacterium]|nr:VWA domain-containing protein [Candidatus Acetothermia bacterium]